LDTEFQWFGLDTTDPGPSLRRAGLGLPSRMRHDGLVLGRSFVARPTGEVDRIEESLWWSEASHFADDGTIVALVQRARGMGAGEAVVVRFDPDIRRDCEAGNEP